MRNESYAKKDLKDVNDGKVTSEQSSHPVGTTVGTVVGMAAGVSGAAIAGASVGAALGPIGAATGAIVGGMVGAGTGHEIAAQINPKAEDLFWRENYSTRPYVTPGSDYATYQPAYGYGIDAFTIHRGRSFDEIESDLGRNWDSRRGNSSLGWDKAKLATRDAYDRLVSVTDEE